MWGGCEIHDCIPQLNKTNKEHKFIQMGTTTMGSLFGKHGRIADLTYDWYNNPKFMRYNIKQARQIYKEVVTKDYFDCVDDNNKKDNWLIISLAREAEARCDYYGEHVTLIKQLIWNTSRELLTKMQYPLTAVEILNDLKYTRLWDDELIVRSFWGGSSGQGQWIERFVELIQKHFEDRVILLHTPPAKQWKNKKWGTYMQLPTFGDYVHIFKGKNVSGKHFDNTSWEQTNKQYRGIYIGFIKHIKDNGYKKPIWIQVPWSKLVGDEDHRWGKMPFHYTEESIANISKMVSDTIGTINE
jgi:hypothetical protein